MTPTGGRRAARTTPLCLFWDGRRPAPDRWAEAARLEPEELARAGLPFVTGTFEAAYVGPAVGRLPPWELTDVLEEFRRVLRVGGRIRVAAYDFRAALNAYTRGDVDFFWDRSSAHLSGALASQLLESGAARSLLDADLLAEALAHAGFAEAWPQTFGKSRADPPLTAPDRLAGHCCFVEALNPSPWPVVDPAAGLSTVHLAVGDASGGSMRVLWCGPPGYEGFVRYRPIGASPWNEARASSRSTVDGANGAHVFQAHCERLSPGRLYEYEVVQVGGGRSERLIGSSFATPPSEEERVRLAFIADTGISGRADGLSDGTARVVQEVLRAEPHVVLGGGDYAYRSDDRRWRSGQQAVHAWIAEMAPLVRTRPLMPQYGNHEVELGERYRDWAVHFPPPAGGAVAGSRSYSFEAGPCHLAAFYAPTATVDPAELSWLWEDLGAARRRGARWLVVYQHQPLVASGSAHPADGRVARALGRVLEHHRVDLHLSAHDQSYERTFPVTWDGSALRPASRGRNRFRRGDGTVLVKVSPAGKRSSRGGTFSSLPGERADLVAAASDSAHHFAVIEADTTALRLTAYRLRDAAGPVEPVDEVVIAR